jgi:hypothetical protein
MNEDVGVGAASVEQSVGQYRRLVKGRSLIDVPSQEDRRCVIPGQPRRIEKRVAERIPEHLAQT